MSLHITSAIRRFPTLYHFNSFSHFNNSTKIFQDQLQAYSRQSISKELCVHNCINHIKEIFREQHINHAILSVFSESETNAMESYLIGFNEAVDTSSLGKHEVEFLKRQFGYYFYEAATEKWANDLAESFYHLTEMQEKKEPSHAGKNWTDHHIAVFDYSSEKQELLGLTNLLALKVAEIKCLYFYRYEHTVNATKINLMSSRIEEIFQETSTRTALEKWLGSGREETAAVKLWLQDYFKALNCLNEWHESAQLSTQSVAKFTKMISKYFYAYAHEINENRVKVMTTLIQNNLSNFNEALKKASEKAENDPSSLSTLENEYVEFLRIHANYTIHHWPDIERKVDLLNKQVWHAFMLQTLKASSQSYEKANRE